MTDKNTSDVPPTTDQGEYTDVETEDGRDTHQDDVKPGEYTDVDLGDGKTH